MWFLTDHLDILKKALGAVIRKLAVMQKTFYALFFFFNGYVISIEEKLMWMG